MCVNRVTDCVSNKERRKETIGFIPLDSKSLLDVKKKSIGKKKKKMYENHDRK